MLDEGASIIDVGAESTRPGAEAIDWREEVKRLSGFVRRAKALGWNISIDTYHPETVGWVFAIKMIEIEHESSCNDLYGDKAHRIISAPLAYFYTFADRIAC